MAFFLIVGFQIQLISCRHSINLHLCSVGWSQHRVITRLTCSGLVSFLEELFATVWFVYSIPSHGFAPRGHNKTSKYSRMNPRINGGNHKICKLNYWSDVTGVIVHAEAGHSASSTRMLVNWNRILPCLMLLEMRISCGWMKENKLPEILKDTVSFNRYVI